MCCHVMVCKTKKMPAMSPDPFLVCVVGSGNETTGDIDVVKFFH